jgi:hypothetical protein
MRKVLAIGLLAAACGEGESVPDEYKPFVPTDGLRNFRREDGAARGPDLELRYERNDVSLQTLHDRFVERLGENGKNVAILDCADDLGFAVVFVDRDRGRKLDAFARSYGDRTIKAGLTTRRSRKLLPKNCAWLPAAKELCEPGDFPQSCLVAATRR